MEFVVKFSAPNYVVLFNDERRGLSLLDEARDFLGLPMLDAKLIDNQWLDYRQGNVKIILEESDARSSGYFAETLLINVSCKDNELNQFCHTEFDVTYTENTGKILRVHPKIVVDKQKLLNWWRDKGYPLSTLDESI
jgi:hypothetical protein